MATDVAKDASLEDGLERATCPGLNSDASWNRTSVSSVPEHAVEDEEWQWGRAFREGPHGWKKHTAPSWT